MSNDRFEVITPKGELQKHLEKIPWKDFVDYGSVKLSIRNGKLVLITLEKTVRIDN